MAHIYISAASFEQQSFAKHDKETLILQKVLNSFVDFKYLSTL